MKIIEVNKLSKEYKYKVKDEKKGFIYNLFNEKEKVVKAVNNISFSVEEGETVAFVGLLRVIFTFVVPSLLLGAIPVEIVKNISLTNLLMIILLTIFWFTLAVAFFYKSLKKYASNNLFGFGN